MRGNGITFKSETKNINLTSESNTALSRFKNGFFVDPLADYSMVNVQMGISLCYEMKPYPTVITLTKGQQQGPIGSAAQAAFMIGMNRKWHKQRPRIADREDFCIARQALLQG